MGIDNKIWSNEKGDLFIDNTDWQDNVTTEFPKGTEVTRYSDVAGNRKVMSVYFVSKSQHWIEH